MIIQSEKKDDGFAAVAESYKTRYAEIKERISRARKEGKDPYIADMVLSCFKPKLLIAEATREKKDIDLLKKILDDAQKETEEAEKEEIINVKKEVEEGAKKLMEHNGA